MSLVIGTNGSQWNAAGIRHSMPSESTDKQLIKPRPFYYCSPNEYWGQTSNFEHHAMKHKCCTICLAIEAHCSLLLLALLLVLQFLQLVILFEGQAKLLGLLHGIALVARSEAEANDGEWI